MGRHLADRGEGVARGSGGVGCAVGRSGGVVADRGAFPSRGARGPAGGPDGWAPDDRDGDVSPDDGAQAALPVGVPVVGLRGVGLDSPAAVLSDQSVGAGAGRVHDPEVDAAVRAGDGVGDHSRDDRGGGPGEAVSAAGGADRLDGDRGRHQASDRRRAGIGRCPGAGPGGSQAGAADRREEDTGQGPFAGDGQKAAVGRAHGPQTLGRGEERGARADQADRGAFGTLDQGSAQARAGGTAQSAWTRRDRRS